MRFILILLLSAVIWSALPIVQHARDDAGGAAFAKSGSSGSGSGSSDDDDDDDSSGSGSGSSGSGSGSAGSGSGSSGSGSGSSGSGSGSSGSGSGSTGSGTSGGSGTSPGGGSVLAASGGRQSFGRDGITIRFADGHVERIRDGRFEAFDAAGRILEAHAADRREFERLRALGDGAKRQGGARGIEAVVEIGDQGSMVEVTDFRGWREIVSRSAYVVKDPNGRTVARRPVTPADILRLRDMLDLD